MDERPVAPQPLLWPAPTAFDIAILTPGKPVTLDSVLDLFGNGVGTALTVANCCLASTGAAVELNLLTYLSTCVKEDWGLSSIEAATITSVVFASGMIGSAFWGRFSDRNGRYRGIIVPLSLSVCFGLASAGSYNLWWLLVLRGITGFGLGGEAMPADYIAEVVPPAHRGQMLVLAGVAFSLGGMYVTTVAWLVLPGGGENAWRYLLAACALPGALALAAFILFLQESPRWLMTEGRHDEAVASLAVISRRNGSELPPGLRLKGAARTLHEGSYEDLFAPAMRRTSIASVTLWLLAGLAYYGVILLIMAIFASTSGTTCSFSYGFILATSVGELVGELATLSTIESWGRIRTFMVLCFLASSSNLWMASGLGGSAVTLVTAFVARASIGGMVTVIWVLTPEIFPTEVRATAHSLGLVFNYAGSAAAPYLVDSGWAQLLIGGIVSASIIACGAIVRSFSETAGRTVDLVASSDGQIHHTDSVRFPSGRVGSFIGGISPADSSGSLSGLMGGGGSGGSGGGNGVVRNGGGNVGNGGDGGAGDGGAGNGGAGNGGSERYTFDLRARQVQPLPLGAGGDHLTML
ncbi:unnamed protein product [Phaeothamnion confervicola]